MSSDPSAHAIESHRLEELRSRAASRLSETAGTQGSIAAAADALAVLHALASSPETAPDALTLLHELQVHQVELDLQAQELHESRAELESALRRQIELYDHQPVGCFTIDPQMVVHELNQTGAEMLGIGRDDAAGLPLDAFFCAESARRFRLALSSSDTGTPQSSYVLKLLPKGGSVRPVLASIRRDPAGSRNLVSLMNAGETPEYPPAPS